MLFSPLYSGSSGNCTFIEAGNARLLVDAGLTGTRITSALQALRVAPETLNAILITHEHTDHIRAAGVLSRRYNIPIYANAACFAAMEPMIGGVSPQCTRVFETGRDFYIGDVNVTPFLIPHDAAEPVGYTFRYQKYSAGVLTDIGHMDEHLYDAVDRCDILLLEANHDIDMLKAGRYPYPLKQRILSRHGHLSNDDSGLALCRLYARGLRSCVLGHLSAENNNETVAMATVANTLHAQGIHDLRLAMAHRDRPCGVFHLE
ncbi:MAG: MBL fold metallo-hydrolase [Clostridiales bacterium]|jgi:phosphoribosyl 1,2-cyclic phosphodiesterase|nr:MBL fold metallo-hydrolase [Clostridiales bacterium]